MNSFIYLQQEKIKEIIINLGYEVNNVLLYKSSKPELGQFQYNGVMEIAKKYKLNPDYFILYISDFSEQRCKIVPKPIFRGRDL